MMGYKWNTQDILSGNVKAAKLDKRDPAATRYIPIYQSLQWKTAKITAWESDYVPSLSKRHLYIVADADTAAIISASKLPNATAQLFDLSIVTGTHNEIIDLLLTKLGKYYLNISDNEYSMELLMKCVLLDAFRPVGDSNMNVTACLKYCNDERYLLTNKDAAICCTERSKNRLVEWCYKGLLSGMDAITRRVRMNGMSFDTTYINTAVNTLFSDNGLSLYAIYRRGERWNKGITLSNAFPISFLWMDYIDAAQYLPTVFSLDGSLVVHDGRRNLYLYYIQNGIPLDEQAEVADTLMAIHNVKTLEELSNKLTL